MGIGAEASSPLISQSQLSSDKGGVEQFIKYSGAISFVMQSKTIKELLNNVTIAMKQVFKCQKVNYLF